MVSLEEMEIILDELSQEFPEEFYSTLNGGIMLLPELKRNPRVKSGGMFILGEYHYNIGMGRYIAIYYGSVTRVYGYLDRNGMKDQLRKILRHEFTHHIESLAGERGLVIKDEEFLKSRIEKLKDSNSS